MRKYRQAVPLRLTEGMHSWLNAKSAKDGLVVAQIIRDILTREMVRSQRPRFKHLKRGSEVTVIGQAGVQVARVGVKLIEGDRVVVYRHDDDGTLWVREVPEFFDGRFVKL